MLRQYFNCNERLEIFLTCFCNILCYVGGGPEWVANVPRDLLFIPVGPVSMHKSDSSRHPLGLWIRSGHRRHIEGLWISSGNRQPTGIRRSAYNTTFTDPNRSVTNNFYANFHQALCFSSESCVTETRRCRFRIITSSITGRCSPGSYKTRVQESKKEEKTNWTASKISLQITTKFTY